MFRILSSENKFRVGKQARLIGGNIAKVNKKNKYTRRNNDHHGLRDFLEIEHFNHATINSGLSNTIYIMREGLGILIRLCL